MDTSEPEHMSAGPTRAGAGRTLGGGPVPAEPSASSGQQTPSSRQAPRRGLNTLKDIQSQGARHSHGSNSGHDDDEDDEDEQQDFFAGGEKSGLAVQNPNAANPRDHINSILNRARRYV